jgi:Ca2+-transporting ATPase
MMHTRPGTGSGPDSAPAWHTLDADATLARLGVSAEKGLSNGEAARRLQTAGPNELIERGQRGPWRILWEQLTATMVLILIAAAVISAIVSDFKDAAVILAIVVLFALLGFVQEYRAERAMAALKRLSTPTVRVRRGGQIEQVSARDVVPGDVVLLEAGNLVPADARLLESVNLRIQEAALTGESEPVEKTVATIAGQDVALSDRRNLAYMGTVVTYGRGQAVVVATGMNTELGRIAALLQDVRHELTPLQRRLNQLGKAIGVIALAVAGLIFVLGVIRGEDWQLMLMTAVSVAVAAVPEGLPAVVTITLALGAQRMLQRQALLRKLPAVETLGSVTVICSDKTGTLTENRMTVTVLDAAGHRIDLTEPLDSRGRATASAAEVATPATATAAVDLLVAAGALCNDAVLQLDAAGTRHAIGDPTEGALVVASARLGLLKADLETILPRVAEAPFDSDRKRMTTVHGWPTAELPAVLQPAWTALVAAAPDARYLAVTKGAADGLLDLSTHVWGEQGPEPLDRAWRQRLDASANDLAKQGMRVLGVACRPLMDAPAGDDASQLERDLLFIGLVGLIDPPRAEVRSAVAACLTAGIRPVMITGDHALTALHIARQLGITTGDRVLTGADLESMSAEALESVVDEVTVYARVSPEHKLKIVAALQVRGHIVAMTGDGVNDAPALKRADIGVAMGITGTDVSKEAADMVLRDDNFATIVAVVEEGRIIYDNLRKFIKFAIAGNIGKILVVLLGTAVLSPVLGLPLTLLPLQLLWLNLLTDGLLGLGLGFEQGERDVMRRPPYRPDEGIFARGMTQHIVWTGLLIGIVTLGAGLLALSAGNPAWQTIIFTTLVFAQIGQALAIRSERDSLFSIGVSSNWVIWEMAGLVLALQVAVLYVPFLQSVFTTQALSAADLGVCLAAGLVVFGVLEAEKWWLRPRGQRTLPTGQAPTPAS